MAPYILESVSVLSTVSSLEARASAKERSPSLPRTFAIPASLASSICLDINEPRAQRYENVILDLGDVLFTWSTVTTTSVSPKVFKKIMRSAYWFEYEKGNISKQEAYETAADEFKLTVSEVAKAFEEARASLRTNSVLVALIRRLKAQYGVRVFAMSNIAVPDLKHLRDHCDAEDWALFDHVFASSEAHERKPNLGFYAHVIQASGIDPNQTIFVDDKLENVLSARSFGCKGIVFNSAETLALQLSNYLGDPVSRAQKWLKANAKRMLSVSNTGVTVHENFIPMLILEATGDRSLVDYTEYDRLFNFFNGGPVLTTETLPCASDSPSDVTFPCDLDTTSIGLTITEHVNHETKMSVMDEMLSYVNKDGIIQTYFDHSRPRIDPCVCVNVLTFFYMHGRGHELSATLDWVYSVLKTRAYTEGTHYYFGGDTFLFFLSRLLSVSPEVSRRFIDLFRARVIERFSVDGDAQQLAMRIIAGVVAGVRMIADYERLVEMQEEDGSFPMGWAYHHAYTGVVFGNKGWTTALAVQAIKGFKALDDQFV